MEMNSRPLGPYRLARRLRDCELEKEALEKLVEELKAQLQSAENHSPRQEEKVKQLTTKLEGQMIQIESLQKQVENLKNNLLQERRSRQQEKNSSVQDKVRELNDLLGQERAINIWEHTMRLQLSKELENTKEQLARQKSLKEMFINKEKETRSELEGLKRLSDTGAMDTMRIATEVGNNIKRKQKKVLQNEFKELKVAHVVSQEKFSAELQSEKDKNKALQQELEQLKVSCQINLRYKTELKAEREKSDSLQKQLEKEIQSKAECVSEKLEVIKQLRAEKDALLQPMEEKIQTVKKNASEKEKFSKELEDLKDKLNKQISTNQELLSKLQAEEEVSQGLRTELAKLKEEQKDKTGEQERETPSMIYRMLSCWRRSKTQRKSLRRKKRNTQPGQIQTPYRFEEEEEGEAGGLNPLETLTTE
ncbi:golgin subfamily A member 6-like protein 22 [Siniperca chuatsi]|uniref:golgin subfamily A member 6-like protein 22 n=1 Tax=Siniperca chuatsi TaxID=119488 RepID=UPI001CE1A20D|nr:golgin subfamily A member 6-like protein 22 [Siniperca chuatsi]